MSVCLYEGFHYLYLFAFRARYKKEKKKKKRYLICKGICPPNNIIHRYNPWLILTKKNETPQLSCCYLITMYLRLWLRLLLMVLRAVHIPGGMGTRSTGTSSNRPTWCGTERERGTVITPLATLLMGHLKKKHHKKLKKTHACTHGHTRTHINTGMTQLAYGYVCFSDISINQTKHHCWMLTFDVCLSVEANSTQSFRP